MLNYERIYDDIYWLSLDTVLRFAVILGKANEDHTRRHFHKETEYDSKYIDKLRVSSINRSYNYYYYFENIKDRDSFTMIRSQDMPNIISKFNEIKTWFLTKNPVFRIKDGRLVVVTPKRIEIPNLAQFKTLCFEPTIIRYDGSEEAGIRISFATSFTDVTLDKFMGLEYILSSSNMVQMAMLMLNYIECPPFGTNSYSISSSNTELKAGNGVTTRVAERRVQPKNSINESFFNNKMKDLE
jgi:hypothetical protein